jgi:GH25 family lysozyme M1 (1,4-beta-N-acetylmuramidase)
MAFLNFIDVSRWQGAIDWAQVHAAGITGAIIKISGGDDGLYYDSKATYNYDNAKANGLLVGGYHFAGHTDPVAEANFFVEGMKPFADNDVFVLDFDSDEPDAVTWVQAFVNRVHDLTGVWCIVYVNGSTRNAHDWSPVAANCGFWIAWYGKDPNQDLPVQGIYIMHQYTSSASIPGISGNVDEDAVYMTPEQFDKYGWHPAPSAPAPVPVIPADPTPVPAPIPEPTPAPAPDPTPTPPVVEPPVPTPDTGTVIPPTVPEPNPAPETPPVAPEQPVEAPKLSLLQRIINAVVAFVLKVWNA